MTEILVGTLLGFMIGYDVRDRMVRRVVARTLDDSLALAHKAQEEKSAVALANLAERLAIGLRDLV